MPLQPRNSRDWLRGFFLLAPWASLGGLGGTPGQGERRGGSAALQAPEVPWLWAATPWGSLQGHHKALGVEAGDLPVSQATSPHTPRPPAFSKHTEKPSEPGSSLVLPFTLSGNRGHQFPAPERGVNTMPSSGGYYKNS